MREAAACMLCEFGASSQVSMLVLSSSIAADG